MTVSSLSGANTKVFATIETQNFIHLSARNDRDHPQAMHRIRGFTPESEVQGIRPATQLVNRLWKSTEELVHKQFIDPPSPNLRVSEPVYLKYTLHYLTVRLKELTRVRVVLTPSGTMRAVCSALSTKSYYEMMLLRRILLSGYHRIVHGVQQ